MKGSPCYLEQETLHTEVLINGRLTKMKNGKQ